MYQEVINQLRRDLAESGLDANSQSATYWFLEKIKTLDKDLYKGKEDFSKGRKRIKYPADHGRMILFRYNPLTKNKLKYYDTYPLVFVIQEMQGGFHGLNLHYLPPKHRAYFINNLMKYIDKPIPEGENLLRTLDYDMLKSKMLFRYFKPTYKKYYFNRIRTKLYQVPSEDWKILPFLEIERFRKANKNKVWNESKQSWKK